MADRDYRITIENNVTINSSTTTVGGSSGTIPTNPTVPLNTGTSLETSQTGSRTRAIGGAISAQFMVSAASRLLNASGNNEAAKTVGDVGRYAFLGVRAMSGDPTAIATLALELATNAWEAARKNAELLNKNDESQIRAGLLDLNGVTIRKDFWTGRYVYSRE